jgi:hypothetical protein
VTEGKDKRQTIMLIVGTALLWAGMAIWFMPWPVLLGFFAAIGSLVILVRLVSAVGDRHYQRLANQQCVNCGYDLRGSTERCPECGAYFGLGWGGILDEER